MSPRRSAPTTLHPSGRRAVQGMGLLEALVALVLLATTAGVLLTWLQQNLDTMRRLEQREHEIRLRLNAQAWVSTLNPAQEPAGEREAAGMRLRWRSEVLARPSAPGLPDATVSDQWRVGLYRVFLQAQATGDAGPSVSLQVLQTGTIAPGERPPPP